MTLVVATNSGKTMHGDLRVVSGDRCYQGASKVRRCNDYLLGVAGDGASCSKLMSTAELPSPEHVMLNQKDWAAWISDVFLKEIRDLLSADGYAKDDFEMLLGTPSGIWLCGSLYECEPISRAHWAIGSGASYALGLLEMSPELHPKDIFVYTSDYDPAVSVEYSSVAMFGEEYNSLAMFGEW